MAAAFNPAIVSPTARGAASSSPSLDPGKPLKDPYLGLLCDVRMRETVDAVFRDSLEHWGRYDVVANCTGYGVIGACEDQDEFEIRNQFETNFWGTMNILQLSLPYFRSVHEERRKKINSGNGNGNGNGSLHESNPEEDDEGDDEGSSHGGRYLIFSSTSGALGVPGLGPYCATKYAVEGLVESMLYEVAAYDIRATLVEPGHVRRDEPTVSPPEALPKPSTSSRKYTPLSTHPPSRAAEAGQKSDVPMFSHFRVLPQLPNSAYNSPSSPAHHARRMVQWLGERQPTSAVKSAELVWQLAHCRYPPLRLLLGAFAVESVRERMRGITEEIEDWSSLSFSAAGAEEKDGRGEEGEEGDEGEEMEEEPMDVKMEDGETQGRGDKS